MCGKEGETGGEEVRRACVLVMRTCIIASCMMPARVSPSRLSSAIGRSRPPQLVTPVAVLVCLNKLIMEEPGLEARRDLGCCCVRRESSLVHRGRPPIWVTLIVTARFRPRGSRTGDDIRERVGPASSVVPPDPTPTRSGPPTRASQRPNYCTIALAFGSTIERAIERPPRLITLPVPYPQRRWIPPQ